MNRELFYKGPDYEIVHVTGMTKHIGCQCYKDCNCAIDFVPQSVDAYSVKKLTGKIRTTHHANLDECRTRVKQFTKYEITF